MFPVRWIGRCPCWRRASRKPAFQTFRALVLGFVGRVGEHTVCGMWQAVRLAGRVRHSRAHDFFARRRWDPDQLGLVLLEFLVTVFVKPRSPLYLAVDDTLFGRAGRKVWGAHYLHDGSQPAGQGKRTRWGNCWVVAWSGACTGNHDSDGAPRLVAAGRGNDPLASAATVPR
jgi:DDE superfamily endonuclease